MATRYSLSLISRGIPTLTRCHPSVRVGVVAGDGAYAPGAESRRPRRPRGTVRRLPARDPARLVLFARWGDTQRSDGGVPMRSPGPRRRLLLAGIGTLVAASAATLT